MVDYKQLITEMDERGMPVAAFAEVARLDGVRFASTSRLNQAFRNVNPLPLRDDVAEQLTRLWGEIVNLQLWCYVAGLPFKIDFRDGSRVYEWVQAVRSWRRSEQEKNSSDSDTEPADNIPA